jgi:hypothetical protein
LATETASTVIRGFVTTLVPGLLQIPDYARAVFEVVHEFHGLTSSIDEAVRTRMERQQALYSGKQIEFVFSEAALMLPIAEPHVMRAQAERIMAMIGISSVRIGILALGQPMKLLALSSYSLSEFAHGGEVRMETVSSSLVINDPAEVQLFRKHFDQASKIAKTGDEARALLARTVEHYRQLEG